MWLSMDIYKTLTSQKTKKRNIAENTWISTKNCSIWSSVLRKRWSRWWTVKQASLHIRWTFVNSVDDGISSWKIFKMVSIISTGTVIYISFAFVLDRPTTELTCHQHWLPVGRFMFHYNYKIWYQGACQTSDNLNYLINCPPVIKGVKIRKCHDLLDLVRI